MKIFLQITYYKCSISEEIDLAKSSSNKECMIWHYWFFNHGFKFQDYVCVMFVMI